MRLFLLFAVSLKSVCRRRTSEVLAGVTGDNAPTDDERSGMDKGRPPNVCVFAPAVGSREDIARTKANFTTSCLTRLEFVPRLFTNATSSSWPRDASRRKPLRFVRRCPLIHSRATPRTHLPQRGPMEATGTNVRIAGHAGRTCMDRPRLSFLVRSPESSDRTDTQKTAPQPLIPRSSRLDTTVL
ncbi:hypothetical protein BIW11_11263 [Tropilaelaps mercedesae]|uniref:Secreted protein n=1 Tax=Tropilaelaps mercedesae TaxID=418985 RepID=A0A1V9XC82_9ACAR|nr:hypothetical protein BIW11_11263 [Tropilaelaps mercedesae]